MMFVKIIRFMQLLYNDATQHIEISVLCGDCFVEKRPSQYSIDIQIEIAEETNMFRLKEQQSNYCDCCDVWLIRKC